MRFRKFIYIVLSFQLILGNLLFWGEDASRAYATSESAETVSTTSTPTATESDETTKPYLPKPNVTVTTTNDSITVTWDEIPGAVEYVVNVNRDTAQVNNQRTYTTRALPEITYRIMVFGYDGKNYGEEEILFIRLKEPAPVYDAGRIDFTGKLAGKLEDVNGGFSYVNWGLVNGNAISLFYKLDANVKAEVFVNDVKNTDLNLNSQSSSSALINGLKQGEKNVIKLAWTNSTDFTQDSVEFIITPPAKDAYALGDSKAGFGSVVDLKKYGKWYLVDNQTLISQNTVTKYINTQGDSARWEVREDSTFTDSMGYELNKIKADKQSPFQTLWWRVNAFDNGEYVNGYSTPIGIVTKEDLEKYTGVVLNDPNRPNQMISSLALANPYTYQNAKSGNKGPIFTEVATGSDAFPNNHINFIAAGSALQNFKYKAFLRYTGEFKGQGTNEDPYVIPTLADGEPVITKLDSPRYSQSSAVGNNAIRLQWHAVEGAEQYILKRGSEILYEGPLLEYVHEGVNFNSITKYTLVARKGDVYSEESKFTIGIRNYIPYPPDFRAEALDSSKVRLTWSKADYAAEYVITRNDQPLAVTKSTSYEDGNVTPDTTYIYKVIGRDGDNEGSPAVKSVKIPRVTEDVAPKGQINIRVNRVYDTRVDLQWNLVEGATQYEIYQDQVNKVWSGHSNTMIAYTLQPGRTYTYRVVASNKYGKIESSTIEVQTAGIPQSMNVAPMNASNATIAFEYQPIEGAVHYVERNPQTKYAPLGNGLYRKTYVNTATGETRDEGIVATVNGKLQFSEVGVERSKYYEYNIIAVRVRPDGSEEVIGKQTVAVTTPADGTGATIYGYNYPVPPYPNVNYNPIPSVTTGKNDSVTIDTQVIPSSDGSEGLVNVVFTDIARSYAKDAINSLAQKGIVKGYSDSSFGGQQKVTRAEFAIFLQRAFGYNSVIPYENEFTDVHSDAWYYSEIAPALQQGILQGFQDRTLKPNAYITREQAASMIANVMKKEGYVLSSFTPYEDQKSISDWARSSVGLVAQESVMNGYPDQRFLPKNELTRQESAMMIYNLLKRNNDL